MGKLIFIGLGLGDERGITLRGLEAAKSCSHLFMENYTSVLEDGSVQRLEAMLGKKIVLLDREGVETGMRVLEAAQEKYFLVQKFVMLILLTKTVIMQQTLAADVQTARANSAAISLAKVCA